MTRRSWDDHPIGSLTTVYCRVPRTVKARLEKTAREHGNSLAGEIERLIELGIWTDAMITRMMRKNLARK